MLGLCVGKVRIAVLAPSASTGVDERQMAEPVVGPAVAGMRAGRAPGATGSGCCPAPPPEPG